MGLFSDDFPLNTKIKPTVKKKWRIITTITDITTTTTIIIIIMDTHIHPVPPVFLNESTDANDQSTFNENSNAFIGAQRSSNTQKVISYEDLHEIKPVDMSKKVHVTYNNYIMTDSLLYLQEAECKGGLTHHGK